MTTKEERRALMLAEVRARRRGQAAPSEPAGAWAVRGACNGEPSLFEDPKRTAEALAVCATCPVLNDCYEWALRNAVDGVAGGMTSEARTVWRKANKIAEPVVSTDAFGTAARLVDTPSVGRGPAGRMSACRRSSRPSSSVTSFVSPAAVI